jgi:hypothetical protein
MFSIESMSTLMEKKGPVITALKIDEQGTLSLLSLDMTPTIDIVTKELRGKATFVGMYHDQVGNCLRHTSVG